MDLIGGCPMEANYDWIEFYKELAQKMLDYKDIKGVFTGVICFFYEKDKVV